MNRYNSDIQLKPLTVQKSEVLYIGIVEKGNSTCSLWDSGDYRFEGLVGDKGMKRKWNVMHN